MKFKYFLASSAMAVAMCATGVSAATLNVSSIAASWSNVNPAPAVTVVNSPNNPITLRWGNGAQQSGYDFSTVATPLGPLQSDTAFKLGTFTHQNWPISGSTLSSVDLQVDFTIGGGPLVSSTFAITHNETPNNSGSCPTGSNTVCDDVVTISNTLGSQTFSIGSTTYTLEVLGFSTDGGTTILNDFLTGEGAANDAGLYAKFTTQVSAVPLPAAGWMLLAGFGGLAAVKRRKKAA